MPTDTKLNNLVINYLTQAQYDSATKNENELYLTPDATPTDLQATATSLSLIAGSAKVGNGINLSGFEYDEATKTLKASGGGGGVSPILFLLDVSGEEPKVRTSITEEEKTNLENRLYNSVYYADLSKGESATFSIYFPEALSPAGGGVFSTFDVSFDEASETATITGLSTYQLVIGEKNTDGTYPITIEKLVNATLGGGGGSSTPSTSIAFKDVTVSELANYVGKFENLHITDCKTAFMIFGQEAEITGVWFSGNVRSNDSLGGSLWVYVSGSPGYYLFYGSGLYTINAGGKIDGGRCKVGVFNQYEFGNLQTFGTDGTFNSDAGSRSLAEVPDSGDFAYVGKIKAPNGSAQQAIAFTSAVTLDATGDQTYCKLSGIFSNGIGQMTLVKDTDGKPKSQKFTTWLPPVTDNSEGKALIVTEGNAQWTNIPRYKHVVNLTAKSAGVTQLSAIFTGYNSSNLPIDSYQDLSKLFGGETLKLDGKVVVNGEVKDVKYLDLHGGGINTDNIAYWQGGTTDPLALAAINLDQFAGLTLADDVCLPK